MKKFLPIVVAGLAAAALSLPGFAEDTYKKDGAAANAGAGANANAGSGKSANAGTGASTDAKTVKKTKKARKPAKIEQDSGAGTTISPTTPRPSGAAAGSTSSTPSAPSGADTAK